jgi:hypothetical protein
MPGDNGVKHYLLRWNLPPWAVKLISSVFPCFLYDYFPSGPDADARVAPYKDLRHWPKL